MHTVTFRFAFLSCLVLAQASRGQEPGDQPPLPPAPEAALQAAPDGQRRGLPLPEGDVLTISIGTVERFSVAPYQLYDAPRSTRDEVASVDIVPPPGDPPTRLPDSFVLNTRELMGATTLVLPLIREGEDPFERRIEVLVVDEISAAYKAFLDEQIRRIFPTVVIDVTVPNQQTAVLNGFANKSELLEPIERLVRGFLAARTGAPPDSITVVNAIRVTGSQTVQLKVVIAEVNRSKMRDLGFDFAWQDLGGGPLISSLRNTTGGLFLPATNTIVDGLQTLNPDTARGAANFAFTVTRPGQFAFNGFMRALEANQLGKIMAKPVLTTLSGQPAYFNSGGEVPIFLPQGNGTISIDYRPFGTNLRFVPTVLGDGRVRLEIRPEVSERNDANGVVFQGTLVPGFTTRVAETTVELESGQTFAIAGLLQSRIVANTQKLPFVGDLPLLGAFFQNKTYSQNDTELLIMVTPHLVDALDEQPCKLPGRESRIPNDIEWYLGSKFEPPCFDDPYKDHWQNHFHGGPMPPRPIPVQPYDNYGRPLDVMTPPETMPYETTPRSAEPSAEEEALQQVPESSTEIAPADPESAGRTATPQADRAVVAEESFDSFDFSAPVSLDPEDELLPTAPESIR